MTYNVFSGTLNPTHFTSAIRQSCLSGTGWLHKDGMHALDAVAHLSIKRARRIGRVSSSMRPTPLGLPRRQTAAVNDLGYLIVASILTIL